MAKIWICVAVFLVTRKMCDYKFMDVRAIAFIYSNGVKWGWTPLPPSTNTARVAMWAKLWSESKMNNVFIICTQKSSDYMGGNWDICFLEMWRVKQLQWWGVWVCASVTSRIINMRNECASSRLNICIFILTIYDFGKKKFTNTFRDRTLYLKNYIFNIYNTIFQSIIWILCALSRRHIEKRVP